MLINEIFPNPAGKDSGNEWLELFNDGAAPASLDGWHLTVNGRSLALHGGDVEANDYRVLRATDLHHALTNRELKLALYDPSGRLADGVVVYGTAQEGMSYSRFLDGRFHWTAPTPDAANAMTSAVIIADPHMPPGVNLAPHGSFTGALGSGMLMAFVLAVFIIKVIAPPSDPARHASSQPFSRLYPRPRRRTRGPA